MENSESTPVAAKKRKRVGDEVTKRKKKMVVTISEDEKKKNEKVEDSVTIPQIFVNVEQPSISGNTWSVILSTNKKDAMKDLKKQLKHRGIEITEEMENNYKQLRIAPKKGHSIILLGDQL